MKAATAKYTAEERHIIRREQGLRLAAMMRRHTAHPGYRATGPHRTWSEYQTDKSLRMGYHAGAKNWAKGLRSVGDFIAHPKPPGGYLEYGRVETVRNPLHFKHRAWTEKYNPRFREIMLVPYKRHQVRARRERAIVHRGTTAMIKAENKKAIRHEAKKRYAQLIRLGHKVTKPKGYKKDVSFIRRHGRYVA